MNAFNRSYYSKKIIEAIDTEGYGWDESWELRDGGDGGNIRVTKQAIDHAVPKDPCNCAIAQQIKAAGLQPVIMKTSALVGDPEKKIIWRYHQAKSSIELVELFDRGERVTEAVIEFRPVPPSQTYEAMRAKDKAYHRKLREGHVPQKQKPSPVDVRNFSQGHTA